MKGEGASPAADRVIVRSRADLLPLRAATGLSEVVIETPKLKHRRLLPLALRYALWAVRPGGRIVLLDDGRTTQEAPPFEAPFNLVREWTFKFLGRDTQLVGFDEKGVIDLERRTPLPPKGWSAGVIFSGGQGELETLETCLQGLSRQPELDPASGGEIVVCGPPRAEPALLSRFPAVRYLEFLDEPGPRFLICRKKNALIRALHGPRVALFHARVQLDPLALSAAPEEFDILSPDTVNIENGEPKPYLSLVSAAETNIGAVPRRLGLNLRNVPGADPLVLHERGGVHVDGGAFFTTKALHAECPLDDNLAWGEGEDVEWCARAFAHGYISDLARGCRATSVTSKIRARPPLGSLLWPVERSVRALRLARAATADGWDRLWGQR